MTYAVPVNSALYSVICFNMKIKLNYYVFPHFREVEYWAKYGMLRLFII